MKHKHTQFRTALLHVCIIITSMMTLFPTTAQAALPAIERHLEPRRVTNGWIQTTSRTSQPTTVNESDHYVLYGQSKTSSSRTIVLNWSKVLNERINDTPVGGMPVKYIGTYGVYRTLVPGGSEELVAQTGIVSTPSALQTVLGPELVTRLSVAMNTSGFMTDTLSISQLHDTFFNLNSQATPDTITKTVIATQRFPELANALGLGYTETLTTNLTRTLRYTIKEIVTDANNNVSNVMVGSVLIAPDGATTTIAIPSNLREAGVYDGPPTVGVINSTRFLTPPERYDTQIMQNETGDDGKVYLIWNKGTTSTIHRMVSGYNVYRRMPSSLFWSKINSSLVSIASSQPYASSSFTTTDGSTFPSYFDNPYYFVDDSSGISSSYRSWMYRVCAVDMAGTESTCSNTLSAIKRDLIPPSEVQTFTATAAYPTPASSAPGKVRLEWTYSDLNRLIPNTGGALPRFFITRAITTGVKLENWSIVASNLPSTTELTATYVLTDTPPINNIYWYRIQVRDNAGNWSSLSQPVKGAVFDRLPPAALKLAPPQSKRPCYDKLPARLNVSADVTQVVVSRRLSQSGTWRLIRRLRPNTNSGNPRGVDVIDNYVTPLPNTPVYYKVELLDSYGNMSTPTTLCVRGGSPNDLLPPRFRLTVGSSDNNGPRVVTLDFGSTSDIFSRTVTIARPTTMTPANVTNTVVPGNSSTFTFLIDTGESLRVGASATALTSTTSLTSTLNSRWVRNVNNFLNLDILQTGTEFLDTPRNMANLGTFSMSWGSANNEACRDTNLTPRKACATLTATGYLKNEKPPMVALFRRIIPSAIGTSAATEVPWLQVTPITEWTLKNRTYVIEDTTIMDATRTYEYMAVAHSSTSYEVIGYFSTTTLMGGKLPPTVVNVGLPANTTTIPTAIPTGCRTTSFKPTAEKIAVTPANQTLLPTRFFDDDSILVDTFDMGNGFTFTANFVIKSLGPLCAITNPATTNKDLYIIGTVTAGTRVVNSDVLIAKAAIAAPGIFQSTAFIVPFPVAAPVSTITAASPTGFTLNIKDLVHVVNATGAMTTTTAISVTLPAHQRILVDVNDPLFSMRRASTFLLHTNGLNGNYDVDGFVSDVTSNAPLPNLISATQPSAVLIDEYSPWFYRISGVVRIAYDVSALHIDSLQAFGRATYPYASAMFTSFVPDNNSAFTGAFNSPGRNYVYFGNETTINKRGLESHLKTTSGVSYVTSYPAGVQITANDGADFQLRNSTIVTGTLNTPTVRMQHIASDADTSYAKMVSTRPVTVRGHYIPTDRALTYAPSNTRRTITIETEPQLDIGEAGIVTAKVATSDTIKWPGFTMEPMSDTVDMTLYLAPATPIGMSTTYGSIPKPAESAWEQIDLGYSDMSDLDPGLNFNGQNSVNYACYGSGVFSAKMDSYLRVGGFSEHVILQGLGDTVKNNVTGYDETLTNFSAIFADNVIVAPSDISSDLYLPYPSDVLLPLQSNSFDSNGCPVGGDIGSGGSGTSINHRYWNFSQQALTYGYVSGLTLTRYVSQYLATNSLPSTPTNVALARSKLPKVILQIGGNMQPLAARNQANSQASVAGVSEWLQNGEFGNVTLTSATEIFNSGMPFTLNDIKLNRYNAQLLEPSQPSTAGFGPKVSGLPSKLLDSVTGELTQDSLSACLATGSDPLGCGLQILDGNNSLTYFGEPQRCGPSSGVTCVSPSGTSMTPREFRAYRAGGSDTPSGDGSIGSAGDGTEEGDTLWNPVLVQFIWDLGTSAIDIPIPLVFLANKSGGVFAGLFKKQSLLPAPAELFQTDLSVVVNGRLSSSVFTTDIGIFFGYAASQAALRALATHRPNDDNTGFKAHEPFTEVKDDVKKWSKTFGYGTYDDSNDNDDPVDMLEDLWNGHTTNSLNYTWGNARTGTTYTPLNDYQNVFDFLEPKLKANAATESYDDGTQGITSLKQGSVLANACTTMKNGQGAMQFQLVGTDFNLKQIAFGTYIDIKNTASGSSCDTSGSSLLTIDRVSVNVTGDGEITIIGDHVKTRILERNIEFDVQLVIGTGSGNQRLEGGLKLYELRIASVEFTNIGVVFGVGQYNSQRIGYFGFGGTGKFRNTRVSVSFLFGMLSPSSAVLRAQYASLMNKLAADKGSSSVFSGVYISVGVQVPIYTDGCMREVKANGELRGWYFKQISPPSSTPISWGGYLSAGVYGEAACLVSARGQLSLSLYETTGILHFDGDAWLAGGIGDCEPNTWNSWGGRWWGDSWCAQAGARVQVQYAEDSGWDVDYDLDVEGF